MVRQRPSISMDIKIRRTHEKSRTGCIRCKQQRKKCDEVKPSCTKCMAGGYPCQYVLRQTSGARDVKKDKSESPAGKYSPSRLSGEDCVVSRNSIRRPLSAPYSVLQWPIFSRELFLDSNYAGARPWPSPSESGHIFSVTQLALLGHYLTNTCRTIPFDADELYVLQVGIPNLAFRSKPLMASLLALAAASKAFDLVNSLTPFEHLDEIRQLLSFADVHYHSSLREIQASVSYVDNFDHILANAALMVLYGLASHCVRIRLTRMARLRNETLPVDLLPEGTQWIYLIRAAHSAYVGLLHDPGHGALEEAIYESSDSADSSDSMSSFDIPTLYESRVLSPENGPSEKTRNMLFPIVAATQASAFQKLRDRCQAVAASEYSQDFLDPEMQSCFVAMEILNDIATTVFVDEAIDPQFTEQPNLKSEPCLEGPLSKVSPWLRTYIARVTSVEPSKPLRRTVTAFLNQVPMDYLRLVQSMLDNLTEDPENQSPYYLDDEPSLSCPKNQLALEIFAHWLVLVMLLDGVWWIGDIGDWEMKRIMSFMERRELHSNAEDGWWPKTMFSIRQDLF